MANKLLEVRKQVKKRKPTYKRGQSNQFPKLARDSKWRRPKGMGNKNRRNRRGHVGTLKVGYGSPKAVRGLNKDGLQEVLVQNVADLDKVTSKEQTAVIGKNVGGRKRIDILKAAESKKISIANVKDTAAALKSLVKEKKETPKKKSTPKVEEKKEESKPKEEKKETSTKKEGGAKK